MMKLFLARWRLLAALTGALALAGYVGVLNVEKATLRAELAALNTDLVIEQGKYQQCAADLKNVREARKSDATVPDDLGGFTVPPEWLLPFLSPSTAPE